MDAQGRWRCINEFIAGAHKETGKKREATCRFCTRPFPYVRGKILCGADCRIAYLKSRRIHPAIRHCTFCGTPFPFDQHRARKKLCDLHSDERAKYLAGLKQKPHNTDHTLVKEMRNRMRAMTWQPLGQYT